jgi:HEAT repeat protein
MKSLAYLHLFLLHEQGEDIQEISPERISQLAALLLAGCAAFVNFQPAKAAQDLRQGNNRGELIDNQTQSPLASNAICKTPFLGSNFLQLRSRGYRVCLLQIQLNNWGFPLNREGREFQVNGIFDAQTQKAVLDFQKYHGLQQDGIVGPQTSQILWMPRVSALIRLLKQEDPNLRIRGSFALRQMGERILSQRGKGEFGSGYPPVGGGDIQNQKMKAAIPNLVALLKDKDADVRISAAKALNTISSKAVPALANYTLVELLRDKELKVRQAAAETLRYMGPDAATVAVDPLIQLLEHKNSSVRKSAAFALQGIGPAAQAAIDPLIKQLKVENPKVRDSATNALRIIIKGHKEQAKVDTLIKLLEDKNNDAYVRATAAEALGNIKAQAAVDSLIEFLEDKNNDAYVRASAAEALGNLKAQAAVDPLIKLLEDKNNDAYVTYLRASAAEALSNIKVQAAVNPLIKLLEDKNEDGDVRASAAEALINIKMQAAVDPLIKLLEDKNDNYNVRVSAAEALGNIRVQAAVDPLIKLLEDKNENYNVRVSAAEALGNIKAQAAVDPLIKLLKERVIEDESSALAYFVRASAAKALGNIKAQAAVDPLIKRLEDKNESASVRASAAEALGNLKAQAAVDLLIKCLKDRNEDWGLRLNAFAALPRIGPEARAAIDPLVKSFVIEALQDYSPEEKFSSFDDPYLPPYKSRAFFFTSIEARILPSLSKALREILTSTDNDYKVRYSAAFILGYLESASDSSTKAPSDATIIALKSVVNNPDEDFDIRWMSAFSLARMGQDMNQFFTENNLINPILINCPEGELLDPYTGWCEDEEGGGAGAEGWAKIFQDMLGGKKKK